MQRPRCKDCGQVVAVTRVEGPHALLRCMHCHRDAGWILVEYRTQTLSYCRHYEGVGPPSRPLTDSPPLARKREDLAAIVR